METGLGNQAILAKIDKLRELNVGSMIPLPQLVVVGDQSSGKSSVLENLTGFSFPRAAGLCTRYATQITCCRDPLAGVSISIIPRPDASEELKGELLGFQRDLEGLDNDELAGIFEEANAAMGIRMDDDDDEPGCGAFSEDILKIEIYGPDQNHLTVIDVPGIFRVPTPGLTTETDIALVESMVKRYMNDSRTIILAVIPCNVDIATQEIVQLAEKADPAGVRTMGVLTKPDLATEAATQKAVVDLVQGKRSNLKLGYYVVKNRGADDVAGGWTQAKRAAAEKAFFTNQPWALIRERCGVATLKDRLRNLLMSISKQEIPNVKSDVEQRLRKCKADLEAMGPPRSDESSQRQFLGRLASRFQTVTHAALNGYYAGEQLFKVDPQLRLVTRVINLHNVFSKVFSQRAHQRHFDGALDGERELTKKDTTIPFTIPLDHYRELDEIVYAQDGECAMPEDKPIMDLIKDVFESSRGPDLGTFSGTVLSAVFEEQSVKWEALSLSHVSNSIALVHHYIYRLLRHLCPEKPIRDQIWNSFLVEELSGLYRKAMDHARFLVMIERGRPTTFNQYFNDILQKKRAERLNQTMEELAIDVTKGNDFPGGRCVPIDMLKSVATNKGNDQQLCEDILDSFLSYYKVARKRFVDVIYQQVISHFLLNGDESPVRAFGPDMIMRLDGEQLDMIAGEDGESKQQRATLNREIESLSAALKVLRS
ncbi:hypothetical protein G6O67_006265 [Ophiocordyceps sinensis]|uniref:Interferon-induced GTP-binding protein Mx2 n=1 Tax=Ophiocordyceps sinensis TaxID=72228 RepID=A0A8H4LWD6_9HYPO|nr:hypothetical protein G6O67_006265 [Ophiocordyceps sinensis]